MMKRKREDDHIHNEVDKRIRATTSVTKETNGTTTPNDFTSRTTKAIGPRLETTSETKHNSSSYKKHVQNSDFKVSKSPSGGSNTLVLSPLPPPSLVMNSFKNNNNRKLTVLQNIPKEEQSHETRALSPKLLQQKKTQTLSQNFHDKINSPEKKLNNDKNTSYSNHFDHHTKNSKPFSTSRILLFLCFFSIFVCICVQSYRFLSNLLDLQRHHNRQISILQNKLLYTQQENQIHQHQLKESNEQTRSFLKHQMKLVDQLSQAYSFFDALNQTYQNTLLEFNETFHRLEISQDELNFTYNDSKHELPATCIAMKEKVDDLINAMRIPHRKCTESLTQIKHSILTNHQSLNLTSTSLQEHTNSNNTECPAYKDKIDLLTKKNNALQTQISSLNTTVELLQNKLNQAELDLFQLDLQILNLLSVQTNHFSIIRDLTITNQNLQLNLQSTQQQMDWQVEEAVAAVDAVASMSNVYTMERLNDLSQKMDYVLQSQLLEAASAINAVAATSNEMKAKELKEQEEEMGSQLDEAIHAINAVAAAAAAANRK